MANPPPESMSAARRRLALLLAGFRGKLHWQRVAFTVIVCALVSTQAFFQPTLYTPFDLEGIIRTWLDYFGETLIMGFPIMVAATLAEDLVGRRSRWIA